MGRRSSGKVYEITNFNNKIKAKNPNQELYLTYLNDFSKNYVFATGPAGTGKAQPLDSLVKTPNGWTQMGDLKLGDTVQTPDNKTAKIIGIYPQGIKPVYRITLYDGRTVESCEDHLWKWIHEDFSSYKITTLKDMKNKFDTTKRKNRFFLPLCDRIDEDEKTYIIPPYLLGFLIGDGSLTANGLVFSTADEEILTLLTNYLPDNYFINKKSGDNYDYTIRKDKLNSHIKNYIKEEIKRLELNVTSEKKFIPKEYLFGSINQRLEILQGLIDSDGTVGKKGDISFCSTSTQLIKDVQYLVWSLGGIATISEKNPFYYDDSLKKVFGKKAYIVHISRFPNKKDLSKLSRKKEKIYDGQYDTLRKIRIESIDYVEDKDCQCILLDSDDHLYMTNNFIITHNTLLAVEKGIEFFERKLFNKIIITRPAVSVDEEHGFLPGTLEEKMDPWVRPIMDVFKEHFSKEHIDYLIKCEKIEISPLAYMRGRTFKNAWIVADEMQNATVNQMKLLLTRLGDKSRIVITGDLQQNDQKNLNGLQDFLQKEKAMESSYISTIAFKPSDVERHPAIKDILHIYGDE